MYCARIHHWLAFSNMPPLLFLLEFLGNFDTWHFRRFSGIHQKLNLLLLVMHLLASDVMRVIMHCVNVAGQETV